MDQISLLYHIPGSVRAPLWTGRIWSGAFWTKRVWGRSRYPLSVLVCPLDGVNGANGIDAADGLITALRRCPDLTVTAVQESPSVGPRDGHGLPALLDRATRRARLWLRQSHSDVLIWGQRAGSLMRLVVVGAPPPPDPDIGCPAPWSVVALPVDVPDAACRLLHATLLAAAHPMTIADRAIRDAALHKTLVAAQTLVSPTKSALFEGEITAGYRLALARLHARDAARRHDPAGVAKAADIMDAALSALASRWPTDLLTMARLDWADLIVHTPTPTHAPSPKALQMGIMAYQSALARLGTDRLPDDTAIPRIRLAKALIKRCDMTGSPHDRRTAISLLETVAQAWSQAWVQAWSQARTSPAQSRCSHGLQARAQAIATAAVVIRLQQALRESDDEALASLDSHLTMLIADAMDTRDRATLARLYHARATALAALAWYRPAPNLREQARLCLGEALALYRSVGMGADFMRARRLLARLQGTPLDSSIPEGEGAHQAGADQEPYGPLKALPPPMETESGVPPLSPTVSLVVVHSNPDAPNESALVPIGREGLPLHSQAYPSQERGSQAEPPCSPRPRRTSRRGRRRPRPNNGHA